MIYKILFISIFIFLLSKSASSSETDCSQFKKLSAKYIECNAKKLKDKTSNKIKESKENFEKSGIKEKFNKFKSKKTLF